LRNIVFALLVALPSLLIGWLLGSGSSAPPPDLSPHPSGAPAKAPSTPVDEDASLVALFKDSPGGAKVKEKVELYDDKKLFDYIDGGAPTFIEKNFRKLAAAEMASAEGSELTCDIYDMRTGKDAEAIFSAERSASAKPIDGWAEAIHGNLSFVFHRGRYYVKLTAFDKKAEALLPKLAAALRERMSP
jgi:hypothetical protein